MSVSPTPLDVPRPSQAPQDLLQDWHGQVVPVLDFGSQYSQLIARRVREAGVLSILVPADITIEQLREVQPRGLILSGGPSSVYDQHAPQSDLRLFELGVPVLGICYGMHIGSQLLGAEVHSAAAGEYGHAQLDIVEPADLFCGLANQTTVWMSHGDQVQQLPEDFIVLARTATCANAAVRHRHEPFYGVQFHPEVTHTAHGRQVLANFLFRICQCRPTWQTKDFLEVQIERIRQQVAAADCVICGLSGGVDSAVVAALVHRAVGSRLVCIFVDNGLLRRGERQRVESTFRDHFNIDLRVVDAEAEFLGDLEGVEDPQEKRRRIGRRFIEVFKQASRDIRGARFLAQGTLYPDVIESGHSLSGAPPKQGDGQSRAANIKLHHNVGGLPQQLGFELIEPLRALFKDEVRKLGAALELPAEMIWRHPFPGPGLAVRVIGPVTKPALEILRHADEILLEEIRSNGLYRKTAQVFAVLLPVRSVGVMGDGRTHEQVLAVRAVESEDFMTADWARIPSDVLSGISNRIINEVKGVNRVVYDISSKPPATIEWE